MPDGANAVQQETQQSTGDRRRPVRFSYRSAWGRQTTVGRLPDHATPVARGVEPFGTRRARGRLKKLPSGVGSAAALQRSEQGSRSVERNDDVTRQTLTASELFS